MLQSRGRRGDRRGRKRRQRSSRFHGGGRDWLNHGRGGRGGHGRRGGLDRGGRCRDFGGNWCSGDSRGGRRSSRSRRGINGRSSRDGRSRGRYVVGRFDFTTTLGSRRHDTCRVDGHRVHLGNRGRGGRGGRLLLGGLVIATKNRTQKRTLGVRTRGGNHGDGGKQKRAAAKDTHGVGCGGAWKSGGAVLCVKAVGERDGERGQEFSEGAEAGRDLCVGRTAAGCGCFKTLRGVLPAACGAWSRKACAAVLVAVLAEEGGWGRQSE